MPRGRIGKYNPTVVCDIVEAITLGDSDLGACQIAGIGHDTFYSWLREKPDFSDKVQAARASFRKSHLEVISKAAHAGDWRASKFLLAVRSPQDYSERYQAAAAGKPEAATINVAVIEARAAAAIDRVDDAAFTAYHSELQGHQVGEHEPSGPSGRDERKRVRPVDTRTRRA